MKKVVWAFLAIIFAVTLFATKSKTMNTMFRQDAEVKGLKIELA